MEFHVGKLAAVNDLPPTAPNQIQIDKQTHQNPARQTLIIMIRAKDSTGLLLIFLLIGPLCGKSRTQSNGL